MIRAYRIRNGTLDAVAFDASAPKVFITHKTLLSMYKMSRVQIESMHKQFSSYISDTDYLLIPISTEGGHHTVLSYSMPEIKIDIPIRQERCLGGLG